MAKWAENPKDTVTISAERHQALLDAEFQLQCLEAGGVDNWEWYSESLQPYFEMMDKREEEV